jgi:glycosyltransferase involved in cell wall biosynthesis
MFMAVNGVSIVICAHNSRTRIQPTLAHLARQVIPDNLAWEVILVDNGSRDDTVQVAQQEWRGSVPLRIIHEPRLGLSYARECGIAAAQYDIISFVDDDNWVCADWVARVSNIMTVHPEVGACGGYLEAVFEVPPPPWFEACSRPGFALGAQGATSGDITDSRGYLWGAGLSIRKQVLMHLQQHGFTSLLIGRQGGAVTGGEDLELCYALRLSGWRLWYDEGLHAYHYMPASRLRWDYLRKLHRAMGASEAVLSQYSIAFAPPGRSKLSKFARAWYGQTLLQIMSLLRHPRLLLRYVTPHQTGDPGILQVDRTLGCLTTLFTQRHQVDTIHQNLRRTDWHFPTSAHP